MRRNWPVVPEETGNGVKPSKFGYYFSPKVRDLLSQFDLFIQPSLYPFITSLTADPFITKYLGLSFTLLTTQYSNLSQSNFEGLTPKPFFMSYE
jgi:hypothetical protein